MRVDYLWRNNNTGDILLAVEHENAVSKIQRLLSEEIQHLVDLKAIQKIAIVYPSLGDVERLLVGFGRKLQSRQYHLAIGILPAEEYLIIVGHTTRSDGRPAMEWKAHRFHATGAKEPTESHVIFQKA